MDTFSSLPDNSLNMTFNSPQIPSGIFRFEIPGFQIVVIPTSSPFADLNDSDMQLQFQQDDFSSYASSICPPQLNQEQSYISGAYETSGGSSINNHNNQSQPHHHYDQRTL